MNYMPAMVQLPLVKESSGQTVKTPDDVYNVCKDITDLAQEIFQVLCLNSKNRLINRVLISLGILDASLVHAREVFRTAIVEGAAGIILLHNHPSGDPTPSMDDTRITKQLIEVGRVVDIKVLDHVIIGSSKEQKFVSMREDGICKF